MKKKKIKNNVFEIPKKAGLLEKLNSKIKHSLLKDFEKLKQY